MATHKHSTRVNGGTAPAMGRATVLLNEGQAAELLNIRVATLRRWRWAGKGPAFRKIGRAVRYASSDLEALISSALRTSTSDTGESLGPTIPPTTEPDLDEIVARALRRHGGSGAGSTRTAETSR